MLWISFWYAESAMVEEGRKIWYLRRLNLFDGISQGDLEAISKNLRDRTCRRREAVLAPWDPNDQIYLVKSGAVRVYQLSADGRELTTAILRP